ncbi:MAG: 4a-hydroxytetrahydrobiopterin dehydratase [Vicinamibacterales bacterium]
MSVCDLRDRTCQPCQGGTPPLDAEACAKLMGELHGDWRLDAAARSLSRRFEFKGFAKAVQMANLAAWLGDKQGHHPDVTFGWGYCAVTYTTHEIGGLSENDFICAAKLDALVA